MHFKLAFSRDPEGTLRVTAAKFSQNGMDNRTVVAVYQSDFSFV
jgi:hypothetical protein